ncbi:MAG: PAS domain-containing protein [Phycisphaeraceae bacterium]|nr:PAS domain-containing protein [Phycisphaeraceae bacterium]
MSVAPRWERVLLVVCAVVATALPLIFMALTENKSDKAITQYDLHSHSFTHYIIAISVIYMVVFIAFASLEQVRLRARVWAPVVGVGFCFAGGIDALHDIWASELQRHIPMGTDAAFAASSNAEALVWAYSRTVAVLLTIGAVAFSFWPLPATVSPLRRLMSVCVVGVGAIAISHFLLMGQANENLEVVWFPKATVKRPWDLLPFALLLISLPLLIKFFKKRKTLFAQGLCLAVLPFAVSHLVMAFGSQNQYDAASHAAHYLNIAGYGVCLIGLMLDHSHTYLQIRSGNEMLHRAIETQLEAERARFEAESINTTLVESLQACVFRKDMEGRFTHVNVRLCEMLGTEPEQMIGKTDADFHKPEMAEKYRADDKQVIESGESLEQVEEHPGPDGHIIQTRVLKSPIRDRDGDIIGIQGMFWKTVQPKQASDS